LKIEDMDPNLLRNGDIVMVIPKHFTTEGSWSHPGGKLLRAGPDTLTDAELLAVLISSGAPQKSAEQIAQELISKFQSFRGMAEQDVKELMKIKGLGQVKLCRIAAAFEIARRIVNQILEEKQA
jgi:DNA repair protein RadC